MPDFLDRDDAPVGWRECGAGEPVIFLHAMVTSRSGWDPQLRALGASFRCIAWDMPGYGTSAPAPDDAGMEHALARLGRFVSGTLGLSSAHFVGLSVGGMILQHLAARNPALVRSIAVLDCSPRFGFGGGGTGAEFEAWVAGELDARRIEDFSHGMVRAIVGPQATPAAIAAADQAMGRASRKGLEFATRLIARHDALDLLPAITCPTLAMAGAQDAETPPAYAREIAVRIPGANLSIIPGAGHISNLEAPEAVTARLHTFLTHGL